MSLRVTHALHEGPTLAPASHQENMRAVALAHVAGGLPQVQGGLGYGFLLQEAFLDGNDHRLNLAGHSNRVSQVQPQGWVLGHGAGIWHRVNSGSCWGREPLWAWGLDCVARRATCRFQGDKGSG